MADNPFPSDNNSSPPMFKCYTKHSNKHTDLLPKPGRKAEAKHPKGGSRATRHLKHYGAKY